MLTTLLLAPLLSAAMPQLSVAKPQRTCASWNFAGRATFEQSNGIMVQLSIKRAGAYLSGNAEFYSPTLGTVVKGPIEGSIQGNRISLKIQWRRDHHIVQENYRETGVYEGTISKLGEVSGATWPFQRPAARTSWYMHGRTPCAVWQ